MNNFLLIVSVGLIAIHAHGADDRRHGYKSQQFNRQNQSSQTPSQDLIGTIEIPLNRGTIEILLDHGRGTALLSDALTPGCGYIRDDKRYMLFYATKIDHDLAATDKKWRVGCVAFNNENGAITNVSGNVSGLLYKIKVMEYTGDLFATKETASEYGVTSFDTEDAALAFIRNNSKRYFDDYFKKLDKWRAEAHAEYEKYKTPNSKTETDNT